VDKFMAVLRDSTLYAATFDKKLARLMNRDYAKPNFPTKHLLKDAELILNEAADLGLNTNGIAGVRTSLSVLPIRPTPYFSRPAHGMCPVGNRHSRGS
jgi:3-hydroxyisobutyrate dehydrogenase